VVPLVSLSWSQWTANHHADPGCFPTPPETADTFLSEAALSRNFGNTPIPISRLRADLRLIILNTILPLPRRVFLPPIWLPLPPQKLLSSLVMTRYVAQQGARDFFFPYFSISPSCPGFL